MKELLGFFSFQTEKYEKLKEKYNKMVKIINAMCKKQKKTIGYSLKEEYEWFFRDCTIELEKLKRIIEEV